MLLRGGRLRQNRVAFTALAFSKPNDRAKAIQLYAKFSVLIEQLLMACLPRVAGASI